MIIESEKTSRTKFEYNCSLRRILPWPGITLPNFGCAEALVKPNDKTIPHSHSYEEVFYINHGKGKMHIEEVSSNIKKGDLIYIPSNKNHYLENISNKRNLKFTCIWW